MRFPNSSVCLTNARFFSRRFSGLQRRLIASAIYRPGFRSSESSLLVLQHSFTNSSVRENSLVLPDADAENPHKRKRIFADEWNNSASTSHGISMAAAESQSTVAQEIASRSSDTEIATCWGILVAARLQ
jgi:hypothetical protein